MNKLNTERADQLVYENELLKLTVLGGIKIEGLDRMRVTLKVELQNSSRPPVRHNLDLYNDNQLEKFIRKVAEKLEIGTSVLSASFSELTTQLENYRLAEQEVLQGEVPAFTKLSHEESESAKTFLVQPDLMRRTAELLQQTGIVGEQVNSMILYLAMSSRKCKDPLSVVCLAKSGIGKSYLMEKVADCIPIEDKREHTQFSGNSFYYFKREEIKGTVFLIEDLDGAQEVLFPIRELQTKKRISKTVTSKDNNGQLRTITLVVEGPVSVVGCTTKEQIYEDNANRSILIYLDHGKEQDSNILDYQKQLKAGLIDQDQEDQAKKILQHTQCVLEPVKIINPYAPLIHLPKEVFKPRRTMGLLLNFIEAITHYHQLQREEKAETATGEVYIETAPEDIQYAFDLLKETLFRKSDELSGASRSFYEWLHSKKEFRETAFYGHEIREEQRIHPRTLQRHLKELVEFQYISIVGGNKHKTGYQYQLNKQQQAKHLQSAIEQQLEQIMQQVQLAHEKRKKHVRVSQCDNERQKLRSRKQPTNKQ